MSDQYKKLHMDDVSRSRILQTVEEADLDTYRDRPEFIQKERPELAEVGDPASLKSRTQSSERPGFRRGMSRSLMNLMTIAAAAALTLLIAVPLIRINSGKPLPGKKTLPGEQPLPGKKTLPKEQPLPKKEILPQKQPLPGQKTLPWQQPLPRRNSLLIQL